MRMFVASYNIHRGFGRDGRYDSTRIVHVLQELGADIIGLQEVDMRGPDTVQLLPWLAAQLNMTAIAGAVRSTAEGDYGNALLTRLPVERVRQWDLSIGDHEPRGVLDIDMAWNGRSIQVLNTHLGLWPSERAPQVKRLLELLDVSRRDLTILMGDLNEWISWGESLRNLQRVFHIKEAPETFPSAWPLLALDRIWVAPASALIKTEAHQSALSQIASDHLPVVGEICLGEAEHEPART